MLRFILAVVIATVLINAWSFASWAAMNWRDDSIVEFPDHDRLTTLIEESKIKSGFYYFPPMAESMDPNSAESKAWQEAHAGKPRGTIAFDADPPAEAMPPTMLAYNALADFLTVLFAAAVVCVSGAPSFGKRFAMVLAMGVVVAARADFLPWVWWHSPDELTMINVADQLIRFVLLAVVIAAIIRPRKAAAIVVD
jgi:hypothetical protein